MNHIREIRLDPSTHGGYFLTIVYENGHIDVRRITEIVEFGIDTYRERTSLILVGETPNQ